MIVVNKFPKEQNSLLDMAGVFSKKSFELSCRWYYNENAELELKIVCSKSEFESAISAYLSACGFQYVVLPTDSTSIMQNYSMVPCRDISTKSHGSANGSSIFVLLAGLQRSGGTFCVRLASDGSRLNIAVSIYWPEGYPYEVDFAFGQKFSICSGSPAVYWFGFSESEHAGLLAMPYTPQEGNALVTGFGDTSQVAVGNDKATIGRIFNDPMSRKLCFTEENWKSSSCCWGMPGYGKTTLCMNLLYSAYRHHNIKFMVIEPKKDYRRLVRLIPELRVLNTLRGYNPLIPPAGCNPYDYAEVFLELLDLATHLPSESPLPDYIRHVYYIAVNRNNYNMSCFLAFYDEYMVKMGFSGEALNFCRAGRNRIETLFRIFCGENFRNKDFNGRVFNAKSLLDSPCVIEIGDAFTPKMVTVFTYFVVAHVRMLIQRRTSSKITNCLLIEEAHTLLSPILNENLRFDLANMLAEGRGRGISVVICDQSPNRVDPAVSNLCGNVFTFRVVSQADREYVSEQLGTGPELINDLRKQCVLVRTNSMYSPEHVHVDADSDILALQQISDMELIEIYRRRVVAKR